MHIALFEGARTVRQCFSDIIADGAVPLRGEHLSERVPTIAVGQPQRGKFFLSFAVEPVEQVFQVVKARNWMVLQTDEAFYVKLDAESLHDQARQHDVGPNLGAGRTSRLRSFSSANKKRSAWM